MKKLFCFFLVSALLLGLFGCAQVPAEAPSPSSPTPDIPTTEKPAADVPTTSVPVTVPSQSATLDSPVRLEFSGLEDGVVYINWVNCGDYDILFGEEFHIYRLEGEEWVSCLTCEDLAFTAIGYILQPGSPWLCDYNTSGCFDLSIPGTYRFVSDCFPDDIGPSQTFDVFCEFTVE